MPSGGKDIFGVLGLFLIELAKQSRTKTSENPMIALDDLSITIKELLHYPDQFNRQNRNAF